MGKDTIDLGQPKQDSGGSCQPSYAEYTVYKYFNADIHRYPLICVACLVESSLFVCQGAYCGLVGSVVMAVLCDQAAVAFSYSCFMFYCIYQLYQLYLVVHYFVSVFALTS